MVCRRHPAHQPESLEHLCRGLTTQIPDYPIVGHDGELVGGKQHREKPVVLLVTPMPRVGGAPLLPRPPGTRRAVMTIGHVRMRHVSEGLHP